MRYLAGKGNTRMREMQRDYTAPTRVRVKAPAKPQAFEKSDGTVVLIVPCPVCGYKYYGHLMQQLGLCMGCETPFRNLQ